VPGLGSYKAEVDASLHLGSLSACRDSVADPCSMMALSTFSDDHAAQPLSLPSALPKPTTSTVADLLASEANVFDEYQAVFGAPMSVSKRKAIRTRFPA